MIPGQAQQFFEAAAAQSGAEAGYTIERSLRFNKPDSAYLDRTFSSDSNRQTWTFSAWIKRSLFGVSQRILRVVSGSIEAGIQFLNTEKIELYDYSGGYTWQLNTSGLFRDASAWYHIVVAFDTTQATGADRVTLYVNGSEVTDFSTSNYPSQYFDGYVNRNLQHALAGQDSLKFSGYLAEVYFVDGQALAASDFGEYDESNNWNPKEYTFSTPKWIGDWANDTTGTPYSTGTAARKAFDGNSSTQAAANANGSMVFTPSSPITGITKVRIRAQYDSGTSGDILLNGSSIKSSWSPGENAKKEFTVTNLTSLEWQTDGSNLWMSVRSIEIEVDGTYHYLVLGGVNDFYLKFADNSSDAALGTDSSGNNNTWTVNNLVAGQFSPTATSSGDPTSSTDSPFSSGYSVDFDGNDAIRFTGPGTITGDFTVECFVKSSSYAGTQRIFSADQAAQSGERLNLRCYNGNTEFYVAAGVSASGTNLPTDQWNHIAITRSGSTVSYYLNGSRWATDTYSSAISVTTLVVAHGFGSEYFTGKVSNARFVDKQALYTGSSYTQPTSTLTTTSQGAIADNVRLICCHQSSVTATEGTLSAASDTDSLIDSPTNYTADSGNNGGNYCTLNPFDRQSTNGTLSNGNLDLTQSSAAWAFYRGTIGVSSGKYYWELTIGNDQYSTPAIVSSDYSMAENSGVWVNGDADIWGYYPYNGKKYNNDSGTSYATADTSASGSVIGVALDMDNGTLTFYKDGTSLGQAFSGLTGKTMFPGAFLYNQSNADSYNFGQRPFAISSVPTGYKSLCTQNLANPTIADGSTAFDTKLWTGDGNTGRDITGYSFSPDLVWIKQRSATRAHALFDIVRGANKRLRSDDTNAEVTSTNQLSAFLSNGFTIDDNNTVNVSGGTYVGWAWDAGSSTGSNTDGSITSTVRANQSAGFSVVSWDGTSANATVGHGLNAAPEFIITKVRGATSNWYCYHTGLTDATKYIWLNSTAAEGTQTAAWNSTDPTSSVIHVGGEAEVNRNGYNTIAYCFAPIEGFSAFGSYTGNGSSDGTFVYTGFRPQWVLIKATSISGQNWYILDAARDLHNLTANKLEPNTSNAENTSPNTATTNSLDLLSNGFKLRTSNDGTNQSSATYVYAAFAEHPFKTARGR